MTDAKNFILCPGCGKRTKAKALPQTIMIDFPLFCPHCKSAYIIDLNDTVITKMTKTK